MKRFKCFVLANGIIFGIASCAWQQNPTPATMDNSVYNQDASNTILHSVSRSLGGKLIAHGVNGDNIYVAVYALFIKDKPAAISILSTPNNDTNFVNLIKSKAIGDTLFAPKTKIIHSETTISQVGYNSIDNSAAKAYLDSLGFNQSHNFLKRTTYFYQNNETLTLTDYVFPNQKTNQFDM